jgi:hypothetical protein
MNNKILLSLFLFIQILGFSQVNLTNRLVGYFPFNGNANDDSPLNINGIVNNATLTSDKNGNLNNAYLFNGTNSFIDYGTDNRNITDTITISAWIKTSSSNYEWIVGKYDWQNDKGYHLGIDGGHVYVAGRNTGGQYVIAESPSFIDDGNWHHVMAVIYSNTWEIWVDCQLEATSYSTTSNPNMANTTNLSIGQYYIGDVNGNQRYFNGAIDEVRLYNRLLTTDEKNLLCSSIVTSSNHISSEENSIKFYPNPTSQYLTIETKLIINEVNIIDVNGKVVMTTTGDIKTINTFDLPNGVYIIRLTSDEEIINKKFIKK